MTERRFQLALSFVLLAITVWYGVTMAGYPDNAGRVPVIVALVVGAALVVQVVVQLRAPAHDEREGVTAGDQTPESGAVDATATRQDPDALDAPDDPLATGEARVQEVEEAAAGFDVLLALDKIGRRRLVGIVAFSVLFYVGAILVGFVVTTGVLITAFLLLARERVWLALLAGLVCAAGVYALVVIVIGLPALDGRLF